MTKINKDINHYGRLSCRLWGAAAGDEAEAKLAAEDEEFAGWKKKYDSSRKTYTRTGAASNFRLPGAGPALLRQEPAFVTECRARMNYTATRQLIVRHALSGELCFVHCNAVAPLLTVASTVMGIKPSCLYLAHHRVIPQKTIRGLNIL